MCRNSNGTVESVLIRTKEATEPVGCGSATNSTVPLVYPEPSSVMTTYDMDQKVSPTAGSNVAADRNSPLQLNPLPIRHLDTLLGPVMISPEEEQILANRDELNDSQGHHRTFITSSGTHTFGGGSTAGDGGRRESGPADGPNGGPRGGSRLEPTCSLKGRRRKILPIEMERLERNYLYVRLTLGAILIIQTILILGIIGFTDKIINEEIDAQIEAAYAAAAATRNASDPTAPIPTPDPDIIKRIEETREPFKHMVRFLFVIDLFLTVMGIIGVLIGNFCLIVTYTVISTLANMSYLLKMTFDLLSLFMYILSLVVTIMCYYLIVLIRRRRRYRRWNATSGTTPHQCRVNRAPEVASYSQSVVINKSQSNQNQENKYEVHDLKSSGHMMGGTNVNNNRSGAGGGQAGNHPGSSSAVMMIIEEGCASSIHPNGNTHVTTYDDGPSGGQEFDVNDLDIVNRRDGSETTTAKSRSDTQDTDLGGGGGSAEGGPGRPRTLSAFSQRDTMESQLSSTEELHTGQAEGHGQGHMT